MEMETIRQKLHRFIDTIDDKRVQALYVLFEDEIKQENLEYTDEIQSRVGPSL